MKTTIALIAAAATSLWGSAALAHIQLIDPPARYDDQKQAPCGIANGGLGEGLTVYEPGQMITVRWTETINHPGHFRISFDSDGDDDFVEPQDFMDFYSGQSVIADNIADTPSGGESSVQIPLPNVACESCTLQVVQVMYDKPPYGDGNDLYYQCANIALRPGGTPGPDAGTSGGTGGTSGGGTGGTSGGTGGTSGGGADDDDGGCQASRGAAGHALWLIALAALVLRRRRTR